MTCSKTSISTDIFRKEKYTVSGECACEVLALNCNLISGENTHKYWCGEQYEYRGLTRKHWL